MKKTLIVSFSGGRTSAFMGKWLIDNMSNEYEFIFTFANTGQEHEDTLLFIKACDDNFGFNTVWLEADFSKGFRVNANGERERACRRSGDRAKHRIVDYETACRDGSLFEDMIIKADYGIPNKAYPHCTRELKLAPMQSYLRSIGKDKCDTAIGIRIDEIKRVNSSALEFNILYPLVDMIPTTKADVLKFFSQYDWDLRLPERLGNCTWCWKKSMKKHIQLIHENREIFKVPERLEKIAGLCGCNKDGTHRVFFRNNRSTKDMIEIANLGEQISLFSDLHDEIIIDDIESHCGESCEVYPMR